MRRRPLPLALVAIAVAIAGTALIAILAGQDDAAPQPAARTTPSKQAVAQVPDVPPEPDQGPLPKSRPKLVEPVAGQTADDAADEGYTAPTDVPPGVGGDPSGGRVSPGAQSDEEIRAELDAIEREQSRVKKLLRAGRYPVIYGTGRLKWPVSGPVTSPFGQRWGRLHAGIDIGVPGGTPIHASDRGTVVLAGPTGGYGNYVCVQHTASLSTCYAHQSKMLVRPGQDVQVGEVIGYVGCTGHCFGDHLHFEVRVGGAPTNPAPYL